MFSVRRNSQPLLQFVLIAVFLFCAFSSIRAENVILYLKSGDKIAGSVISEYTNRIVLSNSWVKDLSVPLTEIERREIIAAATNQVHGTGLIAHAKHAIASTNAQQRLFKHWKGDAEVGVDLAYSTTEQQTYHGRFTLSYEHPYDSNTNLFFRNTVDYLAQYGRTEGTSYSTNSMGKMVAASTSVTSSDLMSGSDKSTFDLNRKWYVYNIAGSGFDRVSKINLQIEEGPGAGFRLFTRTNLTMNLEAGADYQIQYRSDDSDVRDLFYRVAENVNWKITGRTSFSESFEFFPRVNFDEYRARLQATLSYNLWRYVYLNMSVNDAYDTVPAAGATANELLVHSAVGVKF